MPGDYYRLLSEDDKDPSDDFKDPPNNTVSLSTRVLVLLSVLIIFNMILAATNAYYSIRMSHLLKQYEEKDLASLPRIDPFDGSYRAGSTGESLLSSLWEKVGPTNFSYYYKEHIEKKSAFGSHDIFFKFDNVAIK